MEVKAQESNSTVRKVILMGPESTGKTTLCRALAERYHTVWVPEYLRIYCQYNWQKNKAICTWADLVPIIHGQLHMEKEYLFQIPKNNHHPIFLDTNALTLYVYSLFYYQQIPKEIEDACYTLSNEDYYFLTDIDVPWEFDVLRDRPEQRDEILTLMQAVLQQKGFDFTLLSGSVDERIDTIEVTLKSKGWI